MSRPEHCTKAGRVLLAQRICDMARRDPALTPSLIAARIGCSHVTVRRVLRSAGLYKAAAPEALANG